MSLRYDTTGIAEKIARLQEKKALDSDTAGQLLDVLEQHALREKELHSILKSAEAILVEKSFVTTARSIFDHCKDLIGATSGYVALLSDTGEENEVLFLEAGGLPCDVDPELPMPIRGLREEAYRKNQSVYNNDFMKSEWAGFLPDGHVILKNVMFAPLVLGGKTVGVIGLANKKGDFNDNDAKMASGFGKIAAVALQNSRSHDERTRAEKQKEALIEELKDALAKVKTLSGLLPICSYCKKIRDDSGYWKRIEHYIEDRSEAEFSHSICNECAAKHYPDIDFDEE